MELQKRQREDLDGSSLRREVLPDGISIWHILGGVALAGLAALVVVSIPDIKRYIRMSTM